MYYHFVRKKYAWIGWICNKPDVKCLGLALKCPCVVAGAESIAVDRAGGADEIVGSGRGCVLGVMVCEVFNSDRRGHGSYMRLLWWYR